MHNDLAPRCRVGNRASASGHFIEQQEFTWIPVVLAWERSSWQETISSKAKNGCELKPQHNRMTNSSTDWRKAARLNASEEAPIRFGTGGAQSFCAVAPSRAFCSPDWLLKT